MMRDKHLCKAAIRLDVFVESYAKVGGIHWLEMDRFEEEEAMNWKQTETEHMN